MPSKYGFTTETERKAEERKRKEEEASEERQRKAEAHQRDLDRQHDEWHLAQQKKQQRKYHIAKADEIDDEVRDVLIDYNKAQGAIFPKVKRRFETKYGEPVTTWTSKHGSVYLNGHDDDSFTVQTSGAELSSKIEEVTGLSAPETSSYESSIIYGDVYSGWQPPLGEVGCWT